jgi:hypothetical protein
MSINAIQFQKGISLKDFFKQYGTKEQCHSKLFQLRWPSGFTCSDYGNTTYCEINERKLISVPSLSSPNLANRWNHLSWHQTTADKMISHNLLADTAQEKYLCVTVIP